MDFRKVQFFLAAVRCGSLTEAAAELGVSQPALSKAIKALERSLGVPLMERGRFGVVATPFGEALRYHGQVVEAEFRHAAGEIESLKGAQKGHVTLGCGPTEATRLLPLALARVSQARPELKVSVLYGLNESLMPSVKQGEIDFALSSVPRRAQDPDLLHETLFTESAVVVARADHPLARLRQIALSKHCTPAQLALAWVMAKGDDITPIPGTKRVEILEENVGALDIVMDKDTMDQLETLFPVGAAVGERYPSQMSRLAQSDKK